MLARAADRSHEGYRRLESKMDRQLAARLAKTIPALEPESLYAALEAEIDLFCDVRTSLSARYGLTFDPTPEHAIREAMSHIWKARAEGTQP